MEIFTDERDDNQYKIIKINDLLWFAENLRYQEVPHCFPNRNSDNVHRYGCLYTWENAKKACPPGWRLPTKNEFDQLLTGTEAGSNSSSIRASSWLNGSNISRFSALPAGYRNPDGYCYYFGSLSSFWSATPYDRFSAYYLDVNSYSDDARVSYSFIINAFSIRCVKED